MGFFTDLAVKTAIKKSLLDITSDIETYSKNISTFKSFGEAVSSYAKNSSFVGINSIYDEWELTLTSMVMNRAQSEMPSKLMFCENSELEILKKVMCEWVSSKGGNPNHIKKVFS